MMYLFDNGDPEEFLLLLRNFNTNIAEIGTLDMGANIHHLLTLVSEEASHQFDSLSVEMEITETLNVEYIIKGLALYFNQVNYLSKQERTVRCRIKIPHILKLRSYAARLIDLNKYSDFFPGATLYDKF